MWPAFVNLARAACIDRLPCNRGVDEYAGYHDAHVSEQRDFGIGREMMETLEGGSPGRAMPLTVGIANAVPKLVVYRLLRPAIKQPDPVRLVCWEDDPEQLIARLGTYTLNVVIANAPAPAYLPIKAFNHLLDESAIAFFAPRPVAKRLSRHFPESLARRRC